MFYGICRLSVVPVRHEPSDKSELTTQLLFGEAYQILEHREKWLFIQLADDGYTGWIDAKQHTEITEEYYQSWTSVKHPRCADLVQTCAADSGKIAITLGAALPFLSQNKLTLGTEKFSYTGAATAKNPATTTQTIIDTAMLFLNAPYLWGGRTLFGIDCSGFVQQVYTMCGFRLSRDAYQQVETGEEVHFVTMAKPGDLAFFDNPEGRIVHVGIVLENNRIIHAHGHVRIDQLDHNGIFNTDRQAYSHKLRLIKRIIG